MFILWKISKHVQASCPKQTTAEATDPGKYRTGSHREFEAHTNEST